MAYNTPGDIQKLLPEETLIQLTDDDNTGTVRLGCVNEAIADADAEVDGYCGNVVQVPVTPPTRLVKKLALDIAIYYLFSRRENVPENRLAMYKNAVKTLEAIAKGSISLGAPKGSEPPVTGGVMLSPAAPAFTDERLKNF